VPLVVPDEIGDTAAFAAIGDLQELISPTGQPRFLAPRARRS
jgi:hypothetical protein